MKSIIIATDPYTWIREIGGTIRDSNDNFDLIVTDLKNEFPIENCIDICDEALDIQRRYDVKKASEFFHMSKSFILNNDDYDDMIKQLATLLTLLVTIDGISKIYYQYEDNIHTVVEELINKFDVEAFLFDVDNCPLTGPGDYDYEDDKTSESLMKEMDSDLIYNKRRILDSMAGIYYLFDTFFDDEYENLIRIN